MNIFNITNSFEHPTRPGHTIFKFYQKERADYFEKLLLEEEVWYESDCDKINNNDVYFFGFKNAHLKKVNNINYLVSAKFRKPFIPNPLLKWIVIIFSVTLFFLAIIGYLKS